MRIPESKISEVARAADIVKVIGQYVSLQQDDNGDDYRGICPFCLDPSYTFFVSPYKGIFHCFKCSQGGSLFNFIMKVDKVSFWESVYRLAEQVRVEMPPRVRHCEPTTADLLYTAIRRHMDMVDTLIETFLKDIGERHDLRMEVGRSAALEECLPVLREMAGTPLGDYLLKRVSAPIGRGKNVLQLVG